MTPLRVLKFSQFRNLSIAQVFSDLAAWMDATLMGVLIVYTWRLGQNALVAYTLVLIFAFFFGSILSVLIIDRIQPRSTMLGVNSLRSLCSIGIFFVSGIHFLLPLVFMKYFLTAFYDPATQRVIKHTITEEDALAANSICGGITYGLRVVAPFLGAGLLAVFSIKTIFLFSAFFFWVSNGFLIFLQSITLSSVSEKKTVLGSNLYSLRELFGVIFKKKELLSAMIVMCSIVFVVFIVESYYVLLLHQLGFSGTKAGIALGLVGLGGLFGTLILEKIGIRHISVFCLIPIASILIGLSGLIAGCFSSINFYGRESLVFMLYFISGFGNALLFIPYSDFLQRTATTSMMGGIRSVSNAFITLFMMAGPLVGCWLVAITGVARTFVIVGILSISMGLLLLVGYCMRRVLKKWRVYGFC